MKPANHYASTTPIPDWLEAEILSMSHEHLAEIIINFGWALLTDRWNTPSKVTDYFTPKADQWLNSQSRNTFKELLRWVAMELI